MRKFAIFLFYSFFLVILGRNLTFIPQIELDQNVQAKSPEEMRKELVPFIKKQEGEFSVYYKDLKTEETFGINENAVVTGASMNKLMIVGYLYNLASKGKINLQDKIVIQEEDIQDYGTGTLRYQKAGEAYTLAYLTKLTLNLSDNTAAHVLTIKLGEDNIQYFATQQGFIATNMVNNDTSSRDIGKFYEFLYQNKITNPGLTQELLGYMQDTEFEDRLSKYLPKNVHKYHKTGDAVTFVHDGGIIEDKKGPYILVVMTSNLKDEEKTKDTIGQISKMIYEARNGK